MRAQLKKQVASIKIPYVLDLTLNSSQKTSGGLPDWCRYSLPFAAERRSYSTPQLELFSQQLNNSPFFIDLVQLKATSPVSIPFDIADKRQLFFFFMLQGRLIYCDDRYKPIIKTRANTFLMSYYDKGRYYAYADEGVHIALSISILPEWIESMHQNCYHLQHIIHRFRNEKYPFEAMHQCRIDRKIHRWLYKIYSYSQTKNIGAIDGNLRKYTSYLLEYYDALGDPNQDLIYKVKVYIQSHYRDVDLNVKSLAARFCVTERSLLNLFKKRYQMSVQQYYTELRIEYALLLMNQQMLPVKDVYMKVGYADERSFRFALARYRKQRD